MKTALELINSKGLVSRYKGIIRSVQENAVDESTIRRIKELKLSDEILLGVPEKELAIAADYILTGTPYESESESGKRIDKLVNSKFEF